MATTFFNRTSGTALASLLFLSMPALAESVFVYHARATGEAQIGDTLDNLTQQACEKACLSAPSCAGYNYEYSPPVCTLHGGFTDNMTPVDPYDGVALLSGIWVRRDVDMAEIAKARQADLTFLGPETIAAAEKQLEELPDVEGESFDAIFDAPDLHDVPTEFGRFDMEGVGEAMAKSALHNCLGALKKTRSSQDWVLAADTIAEAAEQMTEIGAAEQKPTIYRVYDAALPTAMNAYLFSIDDFERSRSLSMLAKILYQLDRTEDAIQTLKLRASIWKDGAEAEMLEHIADPASAEEDLTLTDVADIE